MFVTGKIKASQIEGRERRDTKKERGAECGPEHRQGKLPQGERRESFSKLAVVYLLCVSMSRWEGGNKEQSKKAVGSKEQRKSKMSRRLLNKQEEQEGRTTTTQQRVPPETHMVIG